MPRADLHDLLDKLALTLANQPNVPEDFVRTLRAAQDIAIQGDAINIGGDIITATGGSVVINRSDHAQVIINRPDAATLVTAILQVRQRMADEQTAEGLKRVDEYLAAVRDYCTNLPYLSLYGLLQRASGNDAFSLGRSYVDLQVRQVWDVAELEGDWELDFQAEANDVVTYLQIRRRLEMAPTTVAEMMRRHSRLIVLGEGGAGKSTLLRHMAECAWDAPEQIGFKAQHLPLIVPLRWLATTDGSLEERLNSALTSELVMTQRLPDDFFSDWPALTGANWLILLDALDEVPADQRPRLMQWLRGMLKRVGQNRVLITSRPTGYMPEDFDEFFSHYELLPFTPEQTSEFARKWFNGQADHFLQELERVHAGDLSGTPLLLTVAAKVYLETGTLPKRRSALYGQFVDIWLSEAEQRGLKAELGERVCKVAKFALARLALAMTEQPKEVSKEMLTQEAVAYLRDTLHLSDDEAETDGTRFVQVIARRSGVFTRRGDIYSFIHPTFREYLAAVACTRKCNWDTKKVQQYIGPRWKADEWREVVLFIIGVLSDNGIDVTEVVQQIAETDDDGLFFAGSCLVEHAKIGADLRKRIADKLLELTNDEKTPILTQVAVAELLGKLGLASELQDSFLSLAQDNTVDDWAVAMLHQLGLADIAADMLQQMIDNSEASAGERQSATEALAKLRNANDPPAQQEDRTQ